MVNELLGIQYNIKKAKVTDRKVQNLASYLSADVLTAIHKTMKSGKASGIDKVTKEEYETKLKENLENLVDFQEKSPRNRVLCPLWSSAQSICLFECYSLYQCRDSNRSSVCNASLGFNLCLFAESGFT